MSTYFSTCRLCGEWQENGVKGPMIRYAVRHSAHADCALKKWGAEFFDRLHDWQLRVFPLVIAEQYGVREELLRRVDSLPTEKEWTA